MMILAMPEGVHENLPTLFLSLPLQDCQVFDFGFGLVYTPGDYFRNLFSLYKSCSLTVKHC